MAWAIPTLLLMSAAAQGGGSWSPLWDVVDPALVDHGALLEVLGDADGDGRDDVVACASKTAVGTRALAGVVTIRSGADGSELYRVSGRSSFDRLGSSVTVVGDVDGDGFPDLAVGAPQPTGAGVRPGYVFLVSGRDGQVLRVIDGEISGDFFGTTLAALGDRNGDGVPDLLVGAPGARLRGAAYLISGADGAILQVDEPAAGSGVRYGLALAGGADVDGDGVNDFALGDPTASVGGFTNNGIVEVRSGATGAVLTTFAGFEDEMFAGSRIALGDLDGDGTPELVIGAEAADDFTGVVLAWHVASQSVVRAWIGEAEGDRLGAALRLADIDGDRRLDVLAGAPQDGAGIAYVFSGFHGGTLLRHEGSASLGGERAGTGVASGDLDGDGLAEVVVGAPLRLNGGGVCAFDFDPHMLATRTRLSVAAGGTVDFGIDFGATRVGAPYVIVVSGTGVGPTYASGLAVPVTEDRFVAASLRGDYPPGFTGGIGLLDANGRSGARLRIPPGFANGIVGMSFYFAAVTFDPPHFAVLSTVANVVSFDP